MFRFFNPNPLGKNTGDCAVRALCAVAGDSWDSVHRELCERSRDYGDMPSSNEVWGSFLKDRGWKRRFLRNDCPICYTVEDFCREYPIGTYILGLEGHVVAVIDGAVYDTWDSCGKHPLYYWQKRGRG